MQFSKDTSLIIMFAKINVKLIICDGDIYHFLKLFAKKFIIWTDGFKVTVPIRFSDILLLKLTCRKIMRYYKTSCM
jgi:hypothetical protein